LGGAGLASRTPPAALVELLDAGTVSVLRRGSGLTGRRVDPSLPLAVRLDPDDGEIVGRDPADDGRATRLPPEGDLPGARCGVNRVWDEPFGEPDDPALRCDPEPWPGLGVTRGCLDGAGRFELEALPPARCPEDRWVLEGRLTRDGVRWTLGWDERPADFLEDREGGPAKALAATRPKTASQAAIGPPCKNRREDLMMISLSERPPPPISIGRQVISVSQYFTVVKYTTE